MFVLVAALVLTAAGKGFGNDGWETSITVRTDDAEARLALGANPEVRDGIDGRFDVPAVFLEDYAPKAFFALSGGRYWRDTRGACASAPCVGAWEIVIESTMPLRRAEKDRSGWR